MGEGRGVKRKGEEGKGTERGVYSGTPLKDTTKAMVSTTEGLHGNVPVAAVAAGSVLGAGSGRLGMVLRIGITTYRYKYHT